MDNVLSKPVTISTLQRILERPGSQPEPHSALALQPEQQAVAFEAVALALGDNRAHVTTLVSVYVNDGLQAVSALYRAARSADRATLAHLAHKLKSSSAMVGAKTLASLCNELEQQARGEDEAAWVTLVERVAIEFQRVVAALPDASPVPDQPR